MFSKYDGELFYRSEVDGFLPSFSQININLLDLGFKCGSMEFYEREIVNKDNCFLLRIE
jgi:hypothetical protein